MPNRPRATCPRCNEAARRIFYQDASGDTKKQMSIAGWAYCRRDKLCFRITGESNR